MSENSDIFTAFAAREGSLDFEFQAWTVLAHVGESLCDGVGAGVRLGGVPAGVLFGFGDVPFEELGVGLGDGFWGGGNLLMGGGNDLPVRTKECCV